MLRKSCKLDPAAVTLGILSVVLLFTNQFMFVTATGRIGNKKGVTAAQCFGGYYPLLLLSTLVLLFLILIRGTGRKRNLVTGVSAGLIFGLTVFLSGKAYTILHVPEGGRVSMSLGCYAFLVLLYLIEIKCCENLDRSWQRGLVIGTGLIIALFLLITGELNDLGIMQEYRNNRLKFANAFQMHISMALKVVIWSIVIGIPVGWLSYKREKFGNVIRVILSAVQSIPTLALIALMMFPLAFLNLHFTWAKRAGISGIGKTPVFLALLLYELFRIVNSVYGAFRQIDRHYVENAKALGMTDGQIFTRIELPIALPVIISGIRVAIISAISLTSIGAYIGYGGLGIFIINGMPVFSIDMVLLGTIPIMFMIFFFDFVFRKLSEAIEFIRKQRARVDLRKLV